MKASKKKLKNELYQYAKKSKKTNFMSQWSKKNNSQITPSIATLIHVDCIAQDIYFKTTDILHDDL